VPASGILYGGVDGTLFHGGTLQLSASPAPVSTEATGGASFAAAPEPPPQRFYKLEFQTYDGSVDPLNWLN
jgi:hypothetical protein